MNIKYTERVDGAFGQDVELDELIEGLISFRDEAKSRLGEYEARVYIMGPAPLGAPSTYKHDAILLQAYRSEEKDAVS